MKPKIPGKYKYRGEEVEVYESPSKGHRNMLEFHIRIGIFVTFELVVNTKDEDWQ
jgi:hypothetical protein